MTPLRPEQRLRYCVTVDRPTVALPAGKIVAVWPVVNIEHWLIDHPMPHQVPDPATGARVAPDL